jgi:hypothetical protein
MEPLNNFHWALMSLGFMRLYHYLVLQPLSFATNVNLNSIMCPAISDPFNGPFYRLAANIHQTFFIVAHGKLYCLVGELFFSPKPSKGDNSQSSVNDDKNVITSLLKNSSLNGNINKILNGLSLHEANIQHQPQLKKMENQQKED